MFYVCFVLIYFLSLFLRVSHTEFEEKCLSEEEVDEVVEEGEDLTEVEEAEEVMEEAEEDMEEAEVVEDSAEVVLIDKTMVLRNMLSVRSLHHKRVMLRDVAETNIGASVLFDHPE